MYSDWTHFSNGSYQFGPNVANPIVGVSSWYAWNRSPQVLAGSGKPGTAYAHGAVRTLYKVGPAAAGTGSPTVILFCCMQTAFDTGSNCYAVVIQTGSSGNFQASVYKGTLIAGGLIATVNPSYTSMTTNLVYAAQLEWQVGMGSTLVKFSTSPGSIASPAIYDFSDLVPNSIYTDSTSPYGTGIGAGIASLNNDRNDNNFIANVNSAISIDRTRVLDLA